MSVLKNKRQPSSKDYIESFRKLYDFTIQRLQLLPKRKQNRLAEPIMIQINNIYDYMEKIDNSYYVQDIKLMEPDESARLIIDEILKLQKPLIILWDIEDSTVSVMRQWCTLINNTIYYMKQKGGLSDMADDKIIPLPRKDIGVMKYMEIMSKLHKMIYSKIIKTPCAIKSTVGGTLMMLADEALYHVMMANIFPTTKQEYEERTRHIEIALEQLRSMNYSMMALFNLSDFTNSTMQKWAELLSAEIKCLSGLLKSDKQRFAALV